MIRIKGWAREEACRRLEAATGLTSNHCVEVAADTTAASIQDVAVDLRHAEILVGDVKVMASALACFTVHVGPGGGEDPLPAPVEGNRPSEGKTMLA